MSKRRKIAKFAIKEGILLSLAAGFAVLNYGAMKLFGWSVWTTYTVIGLIWISSKISNATDFLFNHVWARVQA